ncbi:MAG: DNA primase [candidate division Zixibacteria bacterium 4484_95]|nr:MAG: DNA primase [candidate division Zixibacteria bacterium 4484_95]
MVGYIPDYIVERIKSDTDILDLISEYVTLKKTGKDYVGLCPFHREKTPSFTVVPGKGFYYCFGCGASGNAVNFIMRHENLDYPEALRFLAKRAGITIPEKQIGYKDSITGQLYNAIEYARTYFVKNLKGSPGYDYVKSRNIKDGIIDELGIGYAPAGWDNLYKELMREKFSVEVCTEAGLLVKKDGKLSSSRGYYDKFRNRLMFPIKNVSGRTIGFGGRALSDEEGPKYLNSPENRIYHKGSVLYGLNFTKIHIRQDGFAIIAEGYFDFISLYQAGIKNVVTVSGTGFTPNQASLLARFCKDVVLLYDADSAGMKATFRAVDILYNAGLEPKIVRLPQGTDPDSFIRQRGQQELCKLIDSAMGYLEFVRYSLPDKFSNLPISRQEDVIKLLVETAAGIDDDLKFGLFVRKAIETFNLPPSAENRFVKPHRKEKTKPKFNITGRDKFERAFLGFVISHPEYIEQSMRIVKAENFSESTNRKIFEKLKEIGIGHGERYGECSVSSSGMIGDFLEEFPDDETRHRLTEIVVNEVGGAPPDVLFSEYILKFKSFQASDRLAFLRAEIAKAEKEGQVQNLEKLILEYQKIQNSVKGKVI